MTPLIALPLLLVVPLLASPVTVTDADLAPISLGRHDSLVRELISRGRWRDAAAKITADTPEARLVRGRLLQRGGDPNGALVALADLEGRLPVLADFIKITRGQALLDLDRFVEAAAAVDGLDPRTEAGQMARRIRARALREAGQTAAAKATYLAMLQSDDPEEIPVALLGLARLDLDADQPARAVAHLRRIDVQYPAHWTAPHARKDGEAIAKRDRKLRAAWANRTAEEEIARAERLADHHRNEMVVAALDPLTTSKLDGALLCRHRYTLGRALRKQRNWKPARPLIEEAVVACEAAGHELAPWARHLAGQAAERLAFEDEAAAHYRAQIEKHPEHRLADDAGYFVIRHLIDDQKDLAAARKTLAELVRRFPAGDMMPDAVFYVAQQALAERDWVAAAETLALDDVLAPRDFDHRDAGRTLYWRARIAQETGDRRAAIDGYRATMATAPLGWYAILAFSRLREIDQKLAVRDAWATLRADQPGPTLPAGDTRDWRLDAPAAIQGPAWDRARLLARLGLADEAWSAFREAGADRHPDLLWLSAWVLDRAGAWHLSHDILRRKLSFFRRFSPEGNTRKHWRVAYPDPFERLVKQSAEAAGIDHHFVWGVIREESGFNARVESFANAVGLMQLILPTAKQMADKADGKITRDALTDPDLNVKLGARYLAHVGKHTGGVMPLWPAGYNAGSGALKRWLGERGDLPLDLFVETIPFEEARGYTKRVVASWATFRLLYGDPKEPLPYISQKTRGPAPIKRKAVVQPAKAKAPAKAKTPAKRKAPAKAPAKRKTPARRKTPSGAR